MKKVFSAVIFVTIIFSTLLISSSEGENEIYFGSYPQTILTDDEIISELEEIKTESWTSFNYYCGDGNVDSAHSEDYAKYQDVIYNGEKYRGIIFESFRPTYTYKEKLDSHHAGYLPNQIYWFKFEPIKWLPLDGENNCFVTEKAIDTQPFICEQSEEPINFESSSIRNFLKYQFYSWAFTESQKVLLNQFSNNTYVKLLTIDDIYNNGYIRNDLTAKPTEYTRINGMKVTNGVVAYWLEDSEDSIETEEKYYSSVSYEGAVVGREVFVLRGIRPVIKLDNYSNNLYSLNYSFDGEIIKSDNLECGAGILKYIPDELEGYDFHGWSPGNISTMPNHDLTLTANLTISKYTLSLNANGGIFENGQMTIEELKEYNSILDIEQPTKEGYILNGWDIDVPVKMPNYDFTLTANWVAASDTKYTVKEYQQDLSGNYHLIKSIENEGYTDSYAVYDSPIIPGFTVDNKKSISSALILPDGSTTLKIYYCRNRYNLTFDLGYDDKTITQEYLFEETILPPNFEAREGYSTVGWENIPSICTKSEAFTLEWIPNKYQISFDTDGGTYINNIIADFGEEIIEPEQPKKEGYTFLGWDIEFPSTMPSENIILTALWEINRHTVTWNINGNTIIDTYNYGEVINTPNVEKFENIIFIKWDKELPQNMPDENLVFSAIYKLLPKIKIQNNPKQLTVIYKTQVTFHIQAENIGTAKIEWLNKNGDVIGQGDSFRKLFTESDEISVRVNIDGEEYKDTEIIKVNNSIWHKIIYVFYRLFIPSKLKIDQK